MSLAAGDMGTRISPADRILFCRAVASGGQEVCEAKDLADPHLNLVREWSQQLRANWRESR